MMLVPSTHLPPSMRCGRDHPRDRNGAQDGGSGTPEPSAPRSSMKVQHHGQVKEHVGGVDSGPRTVYPTPLSTYSRPFTGGETEAQRGRAPCRTGFTAQSWDSIPPQAVWCHRLYAVCAKSLPSRPTLRRCGPQPTRLPSPWDSPGEDWSGLPFPPPGDLPNPVIQPTSLSSPALAGGFFTTSASWEAVFFPNMGCLWQVEGARMRV